MECILTQTNITNSIIIAGWPPHTVWRQLAAESRCCCCSCSFASLARAGARARNNLANWPAKLGRRRRRQIGQASIGKPGSLASQIDRFGWRASWAIWPQACLCRFFGLANAELNYHYYYYYSMLWPIPAPDWPFGCSAARLLESASQLAAHKSRGADADQASRLRVEERETEKLANKIMSSFCINSSLLAAEVEVADSAAKG